MEKVFGNIYRIRQDIPIRALKTVNIYLLNSGDSSLMIDTGMGLESVTEHLRNETLNVIVTHLHIDHIGGALDIQKQTDAEIYIHEIEWKRIKFLLDNPRKAMGIIEGLFKENGVPDGLIRDMLKFHPGYKLLDQYKFIRELNVLRDNDVLKIGEYHVNVLWTPGHSNGHLCIYIPELKSLFTGDHILPSITPNVPLLSWDDNPLKDYLSCLDRVLTLDVEVAYPGHREPIKDLRSRIEELKVHHTLRLAEMYKLMEGRVLSAYELASMLRWDVDFPSWDDFPPIQKYFAVAETLSHLKYLYMNGVVDRIEKQGIYYYKLC